MQGIEFGEHALNTLPKGIVKSRKSPRLCCQFLISVYFLGLDVDSIKGDIGDSVDGVDIPMV